jgi:hypothetical protein
MTRVSDTPRERPAGVPAHSALAAVLASALALTAGAGVPRALAQERVGLEPVFHPSRLALDWTLDGSGEWAMEGDVLALTTAGTPAGAIRRPGALAIFSGAEFGDVSMTVDIRSTAPMPDVTPNRDVLLVVGYQSPTRFYYVHISSRRDEVHNGIFLVDDADRRRIDTRSDVTPLVDQAWHRARVERDASTGRIDVYIGDGAQPIMTATDTTLPHGHVGVGSFDDTAEFRRMRIRGRLAR